MESVGGLLWAKSDTSDGGAPTPKPHLLVGHMLDTAEVAAVLYDQHLSGNVKHLIRSIAGGSDKNARDLVRFLAGIHDIGKISPAFQIKAPHLAAELYAATGA